MGLLSNIFGETTDKIYADKPNETVRTPGIIEKTYQSLKQALNSALSSIGESMPSSEFTIYADNKSQENPPPTLNSAPQQGVPTQTPQPQGFRLSVPGDGGSVNIPDDIAQTLGEVFDPIKEATNSARLLSHPMEMTNIEGEQERGVNLKPNRGENPEFKIDNIDVTNPDGTVDRGLFRINSSHFDKSDPNSMINMPYWRQRMKKEGINSWDDMNDMEKNIRMARLVLEHGNWDAERQMIKENPSYRQWYAAPKDLRGR